MVKGHQNALQQLWVGLCDVYTTQTAENPDTGRDVTTEVLWLQNEPCRLSHSSVSTTSENNGAAQTQQVIKLFISKDVVIPPGSKLNITQCGKTAVYVDAGVAAVYSYHQEIVLNLEEELV